MIRWTDLAIGCEMRYATIVGLDVPNYKFDAGPITITTCMHEIRMFKVAPRSLTGLHGGVTVYT
jgi:hypothetical protein